LSAFVKEMIEMKIQIVKRDLMEQNYGMSMLYGHTVGHAIEMLDCENITHGEAVGLGMLIAAKISFLLGIAKNNLIKIHKDVLSCLGLPTKIPRHISLYDIKRMLRYNKKNYNGGTYFILLKDVGKIVEKNGNYLNIVPSDIISEAIVDSY
jgi:3-dehydroquinate synthetase